MSRIQRLRRSSGHSIRSRLLWLALIVAVPLTTLAALRAWERSRTETERVTEQAHQLAVMAARGLDAQVTGTRTLLVGLSLLLDPQKTPTSNDAILRRLFGGAPARYATLWINDSSGRNIGAAQLPPGGRDAVNLADRQYFQDAIRLRRFSAGRVVHSRTLPGNPAVMVFALPLLDPTTGVARAVVGASIQVDSLEGMQVLRTLPPGSVLTILDSSGVVLWRSVDASRWIGRSYAGSPGVEHNNRVPEGAGPVRSDDGTQRLVSWRRMNSTGWNVYVGIPLQYTLDVAQSQFLLDLGSGGLVTIVVLVFAYVGTRRIVAPIESLTVDAVSIAEGDESRRSMIRSPDEIGDLASAFNQMADTAVERRRALVESESRYRVLFNANPLPVFAWSAASARITDANDAALAAFGYARSEFIGLPMTDLVDPTDQHHLHALIGRATTGEFRKPIAVARRLRHASGRAMDMELHATMHTQEPAMEIFVVAIDVGARNAAANALEESRDQLRQAQKMEALGSFAGGIAHDFNNYLSSIMGFTELAEAELPEDSDARADLREVFQAATRAAALTRQILVFSRKQVVEAEWLDPSDVMANLERMLATLMGASVALELRLAPNVGWVFTDRGQLEQILVNLARNARDAMPEGGSFVLSTEHVTTQEDDPAHHGLPAGDWVVLRAQDSGHGIPDSARERIFEPFFTTKERGRGTGLGLALVYSMVQHAHGHIGVESSPASGTTFSLYLPRSATAPSQTSSPESEAPVRGGNERILVVEDDPTVRRITCQVLERAGYDVATAPNGTDALRQLTDTTEHFALLVSDVVMPGMNGPALARAARERRPDLPVLFMSGYADDDEREGGSVVDTHSFIAKPFSADMLLRKVRLMLDAAATPAST
ncbi:MAG: response regulator [Gemmatimonadaceae bacterium]|nr:response regulator [Gemmatimonadaceae bacterium]